MIEILKQPIGLVLDSDLTLFEVVSDDLGKLTLDTNNSLLNQVTIAKYNATNAIVNLQSLYRNSEVTKTIINDRIVRLNNVFSINGIVKSNDNQAAITPFKIMYSTKSIENIQEQNISFLGISESLLYTSQCKVSIPFYIKNNQSIIIRVYDQKNNMVDLSLVGTLQEGYYVYEKDFNLEYQVESLVFEIEGAITIKKEIRILKNTVNKPLNIRFKNQFGAQIYCQLLADIQSEEESSARTFRDQNGNDFISGVDSKTNLSIDTGYLLKSEMFLIKQILNSLHVEIEINGSYKSVIPTTKKITTYRSREFITTNKLTFTYQNYEAN